MKENIHFWPSSRPKKPDGCGHAGHKGKIQLTEVKAMNGEQAANAAAGIDTLIARLQMIAEIRAAAPNPSVAAGLILADYPAEKDVLDGAMRAIDESADEAMGLWQRFRAMPAPTAMC